MIKVKTHLCQYFLFKIQKMSGQSVDLGMMKTGAVRKRLMTVLQTIHSLLESMVTKIRFKMKLRIKNLRKIVEMTTLVIVMRGNLTVQIVMGKIVTLRMNKMIHQIVKQIFWIWKRMQNMINLRMREVEVNHLN